MIERTRRAQPSAEEDLVRLYLHDIGQHALITREDEADLARTIEAGLSARARLEQTGPDAAALSAHDRRQLRRQVTGGEVAAGQFVRANLRLVVSIAKRYQASGLPLLDLIQEGNLGLLHAVEKFDWRKGFKFSTYATWWIRQAISRGIANNGRVIRLPVHAGDLANRAHRVRSELVQRLGRHATNAEVADELGVTEQQIVSALWSAAPLRSLSEPLGKEGDGELADVLADALVESPAEAAMASLLVGEVATLLRDLNDREQVVLRLRFGLDGGEPRTLEEVGVHFNLTRERIRQIESKALTKLRHPSYATGARELLRD